MIRTLTLAALLAAPALAAPPAAPLPAITPDIPPHFVNPTVAANADYVKREVEIPMRDGVTLHTVIVVPKGASRAPIMLTRTPYHADKRAARADSPSMAATLNQGDDTMTAAGYIRVFQDIRGKYKSGGDYVMVRPVRGPLNPTPIDEGTDAWDTIDWLVKHVPESNGRVGMIGNSYEGHTVLMALTDPHPALKVAVPESPMVDGWIGDDWFHNGAFRQNSWSYHASQTEVKGDGDAIATGIYDDYDAYLRAGSSGDYARKYGVADLPYSVKVMQHPAYDSFWSEQALDRTLAAHPPKVPTMLVVGVWDQEDIYGAYRVYAALKPVAQAPLHLVVGPWYHGQANREGSSLGALQFTGDTALEWRRDVLQPFLDHYLRDDAPAADTPPVWVYETGTNKWRRLDTWPATTTLTPLYLQAGMGLAFAPAAAGHDDYVRPRAPGAVRPAPGADGGRRGVEAVAGFRPAPGGGAARRPDLYRRGADEAGPYRRPDDGRPVRQHDRHRRRLGRQADRRLSRRGAVAARTGRLSAGRRARHLPRPLPQLGDHAERNPRRDAATLPLRLAQRRPRLPARPPHHGPDPVEPVPALRPQPADLRREHLRREARRLSVRRRCVCCAAGRRRARSTCRWCRKARRERSRGGATPARGRSRRGRDAVLRRCRGSPAAVPRAA